MEPADLNRFLASVRKTRFIDYLDPIGMSAEAAFEQRLKWANRNASEAAYADEAEFLLKHAESLREHVQREAANPEEWIDAVEAGMDAPPPVWGGENRVTQMAENDTDDAPTVHVGQLTGLDFMDDFAQDDLPTVHVDDMGADAEDAPTVLRPAPKMGADGLYTHDALDAPIALLEEEEEEGADYPTVLGVSPGLIPEDDEEGADYPTVLGVSPGLIPEDEETEDPTVFVGRETLDELIDTPSTDEEAEDPTVFVGRDSIDEILDATNSEEDGETPTVFLGNERIDEVLGERTADAATVAGKFVDIDDEDPENERTSITRLDDLAAADGTSRPASDLGARLAEVRARRAETAPEDDNTVFDKAAAEHDSLFDSPTGAAEREESPVRGGKTIIPADDDGQTIIPPDSSGKTIIPSDDYLDDVVEEFDLVTPPIPGDDDDIETAEAPRPSNRGGVGSATFPPMDELLNDTPTSTPAPVPSIDTPVAEAEAKVTPAIKPKSRPPAPKTPPPPQEESGGMSLALVAVAILALVGAAVCGLAIWQGGFLGADSGQEVVDVAPEPAVPEPERRDTAAPPAPLPTPVATIDNPGSDLAVDGTGSVASAEGDSDAVAVDTTPDPEPVVPPPEPIAPPPAPVTPPPAPVVPPPAPVVPPPAPVVPPPAPVVPPPAPAPVASPSPRPAPVVATRTPPASQLRTSTPSAQSSAAPVANVVGTWRGDVGGSTSVLLRMRSQTDSNVSAKVEIYDGSEWTEASLNGTYDATSGALALSGNGVTLNGTVNGTTGVGSVRFGGKRAGWKLRKL